MQIKLTLLSVAAVGMAIALSGCGGADEANDDEDDTEITEDALGAARHRVIADVDVGGGVYVANRPGGFYMGRLFPGNNFDREDAWYTSKENGTSYAWGRAYGQTQACLWIGPSRGQSGFTASKWASAGKKGSGTRCTEAQKRWLQEGDAKNIGSHFNCPAPSNSTNGTEKVLLKDAPFYWNVKWRGGPMGYDGGPAKNIAATMKAGTHVWYRYTTRDGKHIVVFVPGTGWGFLPAGVLDRSHTGFWSAPTNPGVQQRC